MNAKQIALYIAAALVCVAAGRYTTPTKTVTKTEIKEVIEASRLADKEYSAAHRTSKVRKAVAIGLPAVLAVWGTLHYLHGEELSTAVAIIRDLAIGEFALHGVEKVAGALDARPNKVARDHIEEKLLTTFRRIPALGTPGMELLFALANNRMPTRTGTVIAQAAGRAIEEMEGFHSAHWVARLAVYGNKVSDPDEMARLVGVQLQRERAVFDDLCKLNFAAIGKRVRR